MAVNYKTIVQLRGEPYILFFMSCLLYLFLQAEKDNLELDKIRILYFRSLIIGFLALSRQWAFLFISSFFYFNILYKEKTKKIITLDLYSLVFDRVFTLSWYYFSLLIRYGSFTAFNKEPIGFSFSNQPFNFYVPNSSDINLLFSKPIRPNFSNQFISIFYSDFWGDYWGYFSFTSRRLELGRNQLLIEII